jgi:hypothetical protein
MHNEQDIPDVVIKDSMNTLVSDLNLKRLQKLIGRFNTFRVLGIENMEIKHSQMLAWLLTPSESHGLGDQFLRKYLMSLSSEPSSGLPDTVMMCITPFKCKRPANRMLREDVVPVRFPVLIGQHGLGMFCNPLVGEQGIQLIRGGAG